MAGIHFRVSLSSDIYSSVHVYGISEKELRGDLKQAVEEFQTELTQKLFPRLCFMSGVKKQAPHVTLHIFIDEYEVDSVSANVRDEELSNLDKVLMEMGILSSVLARGVCKKLPYLLMQQELLEVKRENLCRGDVQS